MSNININKLIGKVTYNGNEIPIKGEEDLTTELDTQDGLLTNLETNINNLPEADTGSSDRINKLLSIIQGKETSIEEEDLQGVTYIPAFAFASHTRLTSVVLPEGVTSMAGLVFQNCSNLTTVTHPSTLTSIAGNQTYANCSKLTELHFKSKTPPSIGTNTGLQTLQGGTIYVPTGSLSVYKTATNWSTLDVDNSGKWTFVEEVADE